MNGTNIFQLTTENKNNNDKAYNKQIIVLYFYKINRPITDNTSNKIERITTFYLIMHLLQLPR